MKKLSSFLFVCLIIVLSSCTQNNGEKYIHFTRADFKTTVNLSTPETIILSDIKYAKAYHVMKDSILLISNSGKSPYFIEIFSLNTRERILKLALKGNGPGEFLSCDIYVPSNDQTFFYIRDQRKIYTIDLDSTLEHKKLYVTNSFRYNPEIHPYSEVCFPDSISYFGYNKWYINDSTFSNHVPAVKRYSILKSDNTNSDESEDYNKFLVWAVNNAHLIMNPKNKQLWLASAHQDIIQIFNDSLELLKTLHGPDNFNVKYELIKSNNSPISYVNFMQDNEFRSYGGCDQKDDYLYIIYKGVNRKFSTKQELQSSEIFKIGWNGELLCNYKMDRNINTISITSDNRYMYCTCRDSTDSDIYLVKYKL
ncbi:MAG: BF3164 family lipoprotein [Rikenellaceae bacterium]|nr:BF3164 family lipoprotein [Rikenellaceae bacterium]